MPRSFATDRWGLRVAPPELRLVQDLVNTSGGGLPDLLHDLVTATEWLAAVAPDAPPFAQSDLARVRVLREDLRSTLAGRSELAGAWTATAEVVLSADGARMIPSGSGAAWLTGAVLIELARAEDLGTRPRLKVCRNERCAVAFYDQSRNNSGVWHDSATCGNAANLRASRARRRTD